MPDHTPHAAAERSEPRAVPEWPIPHLPHAQAGAAALMQVTLDVPHAGGTLRVTVQVAFAQRNAPRRPRPVTVSRVLKGLARGAGVLYLLRRLLSAVHDLPL